MVPAMMTGIIRCCKEGETIMRRFIGALLAMIICVGMIIVPNGNVRAEESEESFWRSLSSRYYYRQLTTEEKKLYDRFDAACMGVLLDEKTDIPENKIDYDISQMGYTNSKDEKFFIRVRDIFYADNPQYFFLPQVYGVIWNYGAYDDRITSFSVITYEEFSKADARKAAKEELRKSIEEYTSIIPKGALPELKERLIHDEICKNVVYEEVLSVGESIGLDQSIYSAACLKKSVCAGYAALFSAVLNRLGVTCLYVGSDVHRWNIIDLHGYWYYVDVTNDDVYEPQLYNGYNFRRPPENEEIFRQQYCFECYAPQISFYDNLDEGWDLRAYSSRYLIIDGHTYFIVNDIADDGYGKLVKYLDGDTTDLGEVEYEGVTYKIINGNGVKAKPEPTTAPEPTITPIPVPTAAPSVGDFVERLYLVALDREPESEGKDYWISEIQDGRQTGGDCARFFLIGAGEFLAKGHSDDEFVEILYKTFFDRESEAEGKAFWVSALGNGSMTRERVIEGFIDSSEWCNICADYGVRSGAATAKATRASAGATGFANRLYTVCLGREAEADGLKYWSLALTNLEQTGRSAAEVFFESEEFQGLNLENRECVIRMYRTFFDRDPQEGEVDYWVEQIASGAQTRQDVSDFFGSCEEFYWICVSYGIEMGGVG